MIQVVFALLFPVLAWAQDQDRFYVQRRKVFVELAEGFAKTADAYSRMHDFEAASLLHSMASSLDRTVEGYDDRFKEDLKALASGAPFRGNLSLAVGAARQAQGRFKALERSATDLKMADEASVLSVLSMEMERLPELIETARRLNDFRSAVKIPLVGISQELSYGCMLHCRYMVLEDAQGHDEKSTSRYYDPAGERAGHASVITPSPNLPHAVDIHFSTLYHRIALMQPGTRAVGVGVWPEKSRLMTAIDFLTMHSEADAVMVFPVNGQKNVPLGFCLGEGHESPNPLPAKVDTAGYPITLTCLGRCAPMVKDNDRPHVRLEDAWGNEVPCRVSCPPDPANPARPDNSLTVCAIPVQPLKKQTQYKAVFVLSVEGRKKTFETIFTTGVK